MIPIFKRIDTKDKSLNLEALAKSINGLQEELEACLADLSSENVSQISTDVTTLSSDLGSYFSGDMLRLCGKAGEIFTAGYDKSTGLFEFSLQDKDGNYLFAYTDDGIVVSTPTAE